MLQGRAIAARCRALAAPPPTAGGAPPPAYRAPLSSGLCIWGLCGYRRSTSYRRRARGKSARRPMPRPRPRAPRRRPPFRACAHRLRCPLLAVPPPPLRSPPHRCAALRFGGGMAAVGCFAEGAPRSPSGGGGGASGSARRALFPLALSMCHRSTDHSAAPPLYLALRARSFSFGGGHRSLRSPAPPPFYRFGLGWSSIALPLIPAVGGARGQYSRAANGMASSYYFIVPAFCRFKYH